MARSSCPDLNYTARVCIPKDRLANLFQPHERLRYPPSHFTLNRTWNLSLSQNPVERYSYHPKVPGHWKRPEPILPLELSIYSSAALLVARGCLSFIALELLHRNQLCSKSKDPKIVAKQLNSLNSLSIADNRHAGISIYCHHT